jgi:hypothetical protein
VTTGTGDKVILRQALASLGLPLAVAREFVLDAAAAAAAVAAALLVTTHTGDKVILR